MDLQRRSTRVKAPAMKTRLLESTAKNKGLALKAPGKP